MRNGTQKYYHREMVRETWRLEATTAFYMDVMREERKPVGIKVASPAP